MRLSKRRLKQGQQPNNSRLVVTHRPLNAHEYKTQRYREKMLEPPCDEEEEEDDDEDDDEEEEQLPQENEGNVNEGEIQFNLLTCQDRIENIRPFLLILSFFLCKEFGDPRNR